MIEPQNTMMPLPAESAPAEIPQGEAGFGEMLAQTLGMVPQVDANAILKILGSDTGSSQEGVADEEAPSELSQSADPIIEGDHVPVGQYISLGADEPILVSERKDAPPPPVGDTPVTDPVFDDAVPAPAPAVPRENPEVPLPVVAQPATPHPVVSRPDPGEPGDGIWQPVLAGTGPESESVRVADDVGDAVVIEQLPVAAPNQPRVVDAATPLDSGLVAVEPVPVEAPTYPEPAPVAPVSPEDPVDVAPGVNPVADPGPTVTEAVRSIAPDQLVRESASPVEARRLPADPKPMSDAPQPVAVADVPPVAPAATPSTPSLDLGRDLPVRVPDGEVRVAAPATVPIADTPVAVEAPSTSAPTGLPLVDAVQPQAAPMVNGAVPSLPVQNTALAERVMQAVELQANQPPPRTMVVDIPEIEGLRLVVSVRSGAEVHVVPSSSSTASSGLDPFMDELQGVLASRGFVMTGDGRRRGSNPHNEERPEPQRAQRPSFRRPQPTDNDLRI